MTIAGMLQRFGISVVVTRPGVGSYVNGVWTPGATSSFSTAGAVQPLNGREMEALPSGERTVETFKIYTSVELFPPRDDQNIPGDLVQFGGKTYRVISTQSWFDSNLQHWKSIIARIPA